MAVSLGWLRKRVFGLSPAEATFARRGFEAGEPSVQQHLEKIGMAFVQGYNAALEDDRPESLARRLNAADRELCGFAFEGAAMGLAILEQFTLRKQNRIQRFLDGPAKSHVYLVHVGLGWAAARLRLDVERTMARLDPLLRWLIVDGYGFHEGYFHWRSCLTKKLIPQRLNGYARRVFDQGLGRSLWFSQGADVRRLVSAIADFPPARQPDLWSGVGLACAYAGGVDLEALRFLRDAAGVYLPHVAQGAAFAAKARDLAGYHPPHTESACQVLCRLPARAAAFATDRALEDLAGDGRDPAYEVWRFKVRSQFQDALEARAHSAPSAAD